MGVEDWVNCDWLSSSASLPFPPPHLLLAGWLLLQYRRVTTVCGGDNSSVYSRTIEKQGFLYHIIISLYATHFRLYQKNLMFDRKVKPYFSLNMLTSKQGSIW